MRNINYKSDFDAVVRIRDCQGREIGWPDYDWSARFYTERGKANPYTASCKDGVCTHCFNDGGKIHVVFNSHRMGKGPVLVEFHAAVPNAIYPDGTQDLFRPQPTDIELVEGAGDCPTEAEIELMAPFIKGKDALEYAAEAGYEGDAEQFARDLAAVGGKVDKVVGKGLSTCDFTEEQKNVVDALPEKVQPLVKFDAEDFDYDKETGSLAVSAAAERQVFRDMWRKRCFGHGDSSEDGKSFTYLDITLTYEEALLSYIVSANPAAVNYGFGLVNVPERLPVAILPIYVSSYGNPINLSAAFRAQNRLRRVVLRDKNRSGNWIAPTNLSQAFYDCYSIDKLELDLSNITAANGLSATFGNCRLLSDVKLKGLKHSVDLHWSPNITVASLQYLISNAANTAAITVTIHKDVYARIIDEGSGDWHALLEAASAKNISFATI